MITARPPLSANIVQTAMITWPMEVVWSALVHATLATQMAPALLANTPTPQAPFPSTLPAISVKISTVSNAISRILAIAALVISATK